MLENQTSRRASFKALGSLAAAAALAGCSATAATSAGNAAASAVSGVAATVTADAAKVANVWGIIKGVGEAALAAATTLAPGAATIISEGITAVDALVASLPAIASDAEQLAATIGNIITQGLEVLTAAAPAVKVTASAS